jgi:hypothetical protein
MTRRAYLGMHCADCSVGTSTLNEYYMVLDNVWEQAWFGRRKPYHGRIPDQEILCTGCLEKPIGRTLTRHAFTDAPTNQDVEHKSARLRDCLTAEWPPRKVMP